MTNAGLINAIFANYSRASFCCWMMHYSFFSQKAGLNADTFCSYANKGNE